MAWQIGAVLWWFPIPSQVRIIAIDWDHGTGRVAYLVELTDDPATRFAAYGDELSESMEPFGSMEQEEVGKV